MRIAPGVGARLSLMMILALLPLGLLSISQTQNLARQAERVALNSVLGETVQAASEEIDLIRRAESTVRAVAAIVGPSILDDARCREIMDSVATTIPMATLIAFIPLSGQMTCASGGRTYDFSSDALFQDLIASTEPRMIINPDGPVSGTSVLGVSHPVRDVAGLQIGIVTISLPHEAVTLDRQDGQRDPIALITFDRDGTLLTSTTGLDDGLTRLPRDRDLAELAEHGSHTFVGQSNLGMRRMFAVVPIEGDLFLLGSWPIAGQGALISATAQPYVFPVLMWIAGLAVALLASERLVTRHLRRLARSMRAFTRSNRELPPLALDNPPIEIASLAETYQTMTATILRDEADLENLLRQKEELLREVHHRTGNSLQLIASILRMHLREEPEDDVRRLLENLHDRVMSLSTVHFGLYRMAGKSDIAVDTLLSDVIAKIAAIHSRFGRKDAIIPNLQPVVLMAQQAVPLALLVAEILSSFPVQEMDADDAPICVTLEEMDGNLARLSITGPDRAQGALTGDGSGVPEIIAGRLIRAFVSQLNGTMTVTPGEGKVVAAITFTRRTAEPATPVLPA